MCCGELWGTVGNMQRRTLGGIYECKLDDRSRFAIPAKVRAPFLESGAVVAWWLDECLIVVPTDHWPVLLNEVFGDMSPLDDKSREVSRFLMAGAQDQDLDKQGRVMLSPQQRRHAGIESAVTVVGNRDYLEVWDPARLEERFERMRGGGVERYARELADARA